jgi:DNA-binding Lrp family transcriptional regulator
MKKFDKNDIEICISLFTQPDITLPELEGDLKLDKEELTKRMKALYDEGLITQRVNVELDKVFKTFAVCKVKVESGVAEEYSDMLFEKNPFDQIVEVEPSAKIDGASDLVYYALIYGHSMADIHRRISDFKKVDYWSDLTTVEVFKGMQILQNHGAQVFEITPEDLAAKNFQKKN